DVDLLRRRRPSTSVAGFESPRERRWARATLGLRKGTQVQRAVRLDACEIGRIWIGVTVGRGTRPDDRCARMIPVGLRVTKAVDACRSRWRASFGTRQQTYARNRIPPTDRVGKLGDPVRIVNANPVVVAARVRRPTGATARSAAVARTILTQIEGRAVATRAFTVREARLPFIEARVLEILETVLDTTAKEQQRKEANPANSND